MNTHTLGEGEAHRASSPEWRVWGFALSLDFVTVPLKGILFFIKVNSDYFETSISFRIQQIFVEMSEFGTPEFGESPCFFGL